MAKLSHLPAVVVSVSCAKYLSIYIYCSVSLVRWGVSIGLSRWFSFSSGILCKNRSQGERVRQHSPDEGVRRTTAPPGKFVSLACRVAFARLACACGRVRATERFRVAG